MDRKAFSLIELLVVVAIIALLASIILPALGKAREEARSAVCKANLKTWGMASVLYAESSQGYMIYNTPCFSPGQGLGQEHPSIRTGFCWLENQLLVKILEPSNQDLLLDDPRFIWRSLLCPTFRRFYEAHPGGSWALTGYHINGNLSQVGGDVEDNWVDKTPTIMHQISRQARSPWLIDAAGWPTNYYGGYPGCPGDGVLAGNYDYYDRWDVKYRHNKQANMIMIDQHVESVRGGDYDPDETQKTHADDPSHIELNLLANGDPWEWHWKYDPYNP